jgi:hypothetical protein
MNVERYEKSNPDSRDNDSADRKNLRRGVKQNEDDKQNKNDKSHALRYFRAFSCFSRSSSLNCSDVASLDWR